MTLTLCLQLVVLCFSRDCVVCCSHWPLKAGLGGAVGLSQCLEITADGDSVAASQLSLACVFQFLSCPHQPLLFWISLCVLCFSESIESFLRKIKECIISMRTLQNTCTTKTMPNSRARYAPGLPRPAQVQLLKDACVHPRTRTALPKSSNSVSSGFIELAKHEPYFNVKAFYNITVTSHNSELPICELIKWSDVMMISIFRVYWFVYICSIRF